MKICIIGNGSLAMFTAARILKNLPDCILTIIAPLNRKNGASAAAGLMLNIFSEIDAISYEMPVTKWKLKNWKKGLEKWNDFFSDRGIILKKTIYSSKGTKIYFDKKSKNELEKKSFLKLSEIANLYKASTNSENENEILLPYEHSIDARNVLNILDEFAKLKTTFIDDYVEKIEPNNNGYHIKLKSSIDKLDFEKVIVAAGSKSSKILNNSDIDTFNMPTCLNGVGSALEIFSEFDYIQKLKTDSILRSPNRGGTCGLHMVQRTNSIYIGASNVVTDKEINYPRLGSVETLIKGANNELGLGNIVRQSLKVLTGYRPISQDASPIFGELTPNLFLSYGHKRDGFTWAPFLSEIIKDWIQGKAHDSDSSEYLEICNPLREKFSDFGSYKKSKQLYLLNEEFSYAQHNEIFDKKSIKELNLRFDKLHNHKKFKEIVCHPELVNINYYLLENEKNKS